jgi:DUF971 family protein
MQTSPPPTTGEPSPSSVPVTIHADRDARTLEIGWMDGHRTIHDFVALRWLCPCAYCRGEAGMPGWLDSGPTLTPEQTRMVDIALVGNYAVAPTWGDGHHTGYYPFRLLRDRCPCQACGERRANAAGPGSQAGTRTETQAEHASHVGN